MEKNNELKTLEEQIAIIKSEIEKSEIKIQTAKLNMFSVIGIGLLGHIIGSIISNPGVIITSVATSLIYLAMQSPAFFGGHAKKDKLMAELKKLETQVNQEPVKTEVRA